MGGHGEVRDQRAPSDPKYITLTTPGPSSE